MSSHIELDWESAVIRNNAPTAVTIAVEQIEFQESNAAITRNRVLLKKLFNQLREIASTSQDENAIATITRAIVKLEKESKLLVDWQTELLVMSVTIDKLSSIENVAAEVERMTRTLQANTINL